MDDNTPTPLEWVQDDGGRHAAGHRPKNVGDCVTRAIAIATGLPYAEVADKVNTMGAERGRKMLKTQPARLAIGDVHVLLARLGWTYTKLGRGLHLNVGDLPDEPVMIARQRGHLCAVIGGVVHDSWDSSGERNSGRHKGTQALVVGVYLPTAADAVVTTVPGKAVDKVAESNDSQADEIEVLNLVQAEAVTRRVKTKRGEIFALLQIAYLGKIWEPLGYADWDAWIDGEFDGSIPLALPRQKQTEAMRELKEAGLTTRAIAAATGTSQKTVSRKTTTKPVESKDSQRDEPLDVEEAPLPTEATKQPTADDERRAAVAAGYAAARKAHDDAEAALTPQEKALRDKENAAWASSIGDTLLSAFNPLHIDHTVSSLEEAVGSLGELRGGITREGLEKIDAALAAFVAELEVVRMGELA